MSRICRPGQRSVTYTAMMSGSCGSSNTIAELVRAATDEEHRGMLQALAEIKGNDHRARYAKRMLEAIHEESTPGAS